MLKLALAAVAALLTLSTVSAPAEAHGRARGGVYLHFGVPYPYYWGPRYYYYPPPPVYYYPPPVVVERAPPTYIERDDEDSQTWWYWCADAKKYYPYVKECPGGWQRVPPQPSN
jgi:hypothetical protein